MSRRLARALSRDRKEGEGGEEDLQFEIENEKLEDGGNEEWEESRESSDGGGTLQPLSSVKTLNTVLLKTGDEEQQRMTGKEEEQAGREKVNLFKALQIDRIKQSISTRDRSDNETSSSLESLDEAGQEGKGRRVVSALTVFHCFSPSLTDKSLSVRDGEDEQDTESKEEDGNAEHIKKSLVKTEEEEKSQKDTDEVITEKFSALTRLKPHQLRSVFSKRKSKEEREGAGGMVSTEGVEEERGGAADSVETKWRNRKTRKARRVTRGRKRRVSGGEDGTTTEENRGSGDKDDCSEGIGGQE